MENWFAPLLVFVCSAAAIFYAFCHGYWAAVDEQKPELEKLNADLAAAIKERDEWKRGWEAMERLNHRALDSSSAWKRELDRAENTIDDIVCALERYHSEPEGEGEAE